LQSAHFRYKSKEDVMPYQIGSQCSGKETICEDACAYDCFKVADATPVHNRLHLQIDAEQCTDCGACALACPEGAIVAVDGFARYPVGSAAGPRMMGFVSRGREEASSTYNSSTNVVVPEGFVVLDGKVESWARLMAASQD
jgi:NAD-dependent dihydropyrimidine dehydrogenase PreA subunit